MSTQRIVCLAAVSRAVCSIMSYVARLFGTTYDSSSRLKVVGCSPLVDPPSVPEPGMPCIFQCRFDQYDSSPVRMFWQCSAGFHSKFVWDSVFFSRIALCGYEYEQYYAFFPYLPGIHYDAAELTLASTDRSSSNLQVCSGWAGQQVQKVVCASPISSCRGSIITCQAL